MNDQEYIHFYLNKKHNEINQLNYNYWYELYNCYLYLENEYYDKLYWVNYHLDKENYDNLSILEKYINKINNIYLFYQY